jgi:hypothetical protein
MDGWMGGFLFVLPFASFISFRIDFGRIEFGSLSLRCFIVVPIERCYPRDLQI